MPPLSPIAFERRLASSIVQMHVLKSMRSALAARKLGDESNAVQWKQWRHAVVRGEDPAKPRINYYPFRFAADEQEKELAAAELRAVVREQQVEND